MEKKSKNNKKPSNISNKLDDWSFKDAQKLFETKEFPFKADKTYFDDCISGMKKLPDDSIDCIIADPPFGLSFSGKESVYNRKNNFVVDGYEEITDDYGKFSNNWISEIPRILKPTGTAWIFSGWTNLRDVLNAIDHSKLNIVNHIIWKYQFGVFTKRKFVTSHYHLLFLSKTKNYYFNKVLHYPLDVWEIKRTYNPGQNKNGTKLPDELVMRCTDFSTKPGDLVLDPFMGNGTTAKIAKGTFRHFLGYEINKNAKKTIMHNINSIKNGELFTSFNERSNVNSKTN